MNNCFTERVGKDMELFVTCKISPHPSSGSKLPFLLGNHAPLYPLKEGEAEPGALLPEGNNTDPLSKGDRGDSG
jgi:hypothetical protein